MPMRINVYDFDKTIYAGDSSVHFYLYCARRHPRILLDLPGMACAGLLYRFGKRDKTQMKQRIYRFLSLLPDVDTLIADFWETHRQNIKSWYPVLRQATDLIISASPEFLLAPICSKLQVRLLASRVDRHTGVYDGLNCHDIEKVRRMKEAYPDVGIASFYSDSLSDTPLAELAECAYRVSGDRITPFFPTTTPGAK